MEYNDMMDVMSEAEMDTLLLKMHTGQLDSQQTPLSTPILLPPPQPSNPTRITHLVR